MISKEGLLVVPTNLKMLQDKVILLWLIVFDQDPAKSYICTSKNKVLACVEGAIRGTYGDDSDIVHSVVEQIDKAWGQSFMILKCPPSLDLFIHQLEIDKHNPLHKLLVECYDAVPYDTLQSKIEKFFSDRPV